MREEELKQFVEKHGYVWLGLKRFKTHDRIDVKHIKSDVTAKLSLTKHIEDFPLEYAKLWFPMANDEVICAFCGSGFPRSEMVIDEEEGLVCKGCFENKDKCRGGHVGA